MNYANLGNHLQPAPVPPQAPIPEASSSYVLPLLPKKKKKAFIPFCSLPPAIVPYDLDVLPPPIQRFPPPVDVPIPMHELGFFPPSAAIPGNKETTIPLQSCGCRVTSSS
ncbi:hypothetical protein TSUD_384700 [Trifolium subterraneum]|uniref:Uncharacterized protein n=1 Tax=Trifolium subterraneum TaxID=3900 RepID=A0A2Z6P9U9_TRISU|nr:hypothetical protein TSUD_384700 [Trifolium subterraneum]